MNTSTAEKLEPTPLDQAAYEYEMAEKELKAAQKKRDDAMLQVIEIAGVKEEGAKTSKASFYKVTTTGRMSRTLDRDNLTDVQAQVSPFFFSKVIEYKPGIVKKELDYLEKNEPEIYKIFMQAITVKPGKPGLKIEKL